MSWRRALVVGLGHSGLAALRLLNTLGVETVRGYDRRHAISDLPDTVEPFLGTDALPDDALAGVDLVVLSPGVPPALVRSALSRVAPAADVHGELGLALTVLNTVPSHGWSPCPTVLVTGTNGKSTVTALVGALLAADGRRPFTGGNLGTPLSALLADSYEDPSIWPDALVLECSSFQLETMDRAPCDVAMVVNVSPDHIDRYDSMEHYARTKARVFAGLRPGGLALLHGPDPWTAFLGAGLSKAVTWVDGDAPPRVDGDPPNERLRLPEGWTIPRRLLPLPGRHNAINALFALMAARHLGVAEPVCHRGLESFRGLPHRMERVRELEGVVYYDDAKATNVAAVLAGLDGFERPFVLIAGGVRKDDDLAPLRELLVRGGRALVGIGTSKAEFSALVGDVLPVAEAETMAEAVERARRFAQPGDAVVLAPACASFDQFRNFAERGDAFAAAVRALKPHS